MSDATITGLDAAIEDMRPALSEPLMWLVPENERHFDGGAILSGFALLLVTSFLAGFQEEAVKQAKGAGAVAARWLAERLKSLAGSQEEVPAEVKSRAEEASRMTLRPAEREVALDGTEATIRDVLGQSMPPDQAAEVARKLRDVVAKRVLPRPA